MAQLSIVSGKGGVGKTTLAAALASRYAVAGQRTVLVSLENSNRRHPVFGLPFGYEGVAVPGFDGALMLVRIEAMASVREYVRRKLPLGRLYQSAFNSRAFRDFAAAAPGFEELMVLGKLHDLITAAPYDQVIFDAPATGHLRQLLKVPRATQQAVRFGPLFDIARKIERRLTNAQQSRLLLPSLCEEMPLRESAELAEFTVKELGLPTQLLLNRIEHTTLTAALLDELEQLAAVDPQLVPTLLQCRRAEARARSAEALCAAAAMLHPRLPTLLESALRLPVLRPAVEAQQPSGDDWAFRFAQSVTAGLARQLEPLVTGWTPAAVATE
ncbi:MAG: ArsA family ATPase [Pseudomonadota bacterium]